MTSNSVVSHYFKMSLREVKYNWKEEAIYFFERQGYKIAYKSHSEYVFKAGSKLGNIISFNPAKVEREAVIREENNKLYCELRVSLDFRICTQLEIEYALWELASFKVFLSKSGNIPQKPNAPELILLSLLGFAKQILKYAFAFIILGAVLILIRIYIMPKINSAIVGGPRINLNENLSSTQRAPEGVADIYIFPFYGFPESLAGAIAVKLSEDLKINVRATPSLPIPKNAFDANRKQYDATAFYKPEIDIACTLQDIGSRTTFIGLVRGSIFIQDAPARFVFACQYDPKFCLIGDHEMLSGADESLYYTRLYKMIKRQIGKAYYKKQPNSESDSLMKSPVMSTADLDALPLEY